MKSKLIKLTFLGAVFSLFLATDVLTQTGKKNSLPRIGLITKIDRLTNSCGYYFQRKNETEGYILLANPTYKEAWMNFDGRDTRLKFISATRWKDRKIGARRYFKLQSGNLSIAVQTIVVRLPNENEMDGGELKAFITINRKGAQQTIQVSGWNGC